MIRVNFKIGGPFELMTRIMVQEINDKPQVEQSLHLRVSDHWAWHETMMETGSRYRNKQVAERFDKRAIYGKVV